MPKCGLYVRVSTAAQISEEGSLKSQLQRLREELQRRSKHGEPWIETKIYVEEGVSGKDLNRPKFIAMANDVKAGVIDTVICTELSRISRSVLDFLNFARFLTDYKAGFLCLKQQFDSTSPHGRVLVTICVALAEFERELTADRTSENMLARARRGLRNGTQVLGYDPDPNRKGYMIPNESEKVLINLMFDKYQEAGSVKEVADFLNKSGHGTKSYTAKTSGRVHKSHKFTTSSVHYHLTNKAYIGENEINRNNKTKDQASLSEKERYATTKAVWPPIVAEEKFREVQRLMRQNGQQRKSFAAKVIHNYILRGLVQCGTCKAHLEDGSGTSKNGDLHFYYRHKGKERKEGCDLPSLRAETLESMVLSRLNYLSERQDIIEEIAAQANRSLGDEVPKIMALLGSRKKEYAHLCRELERWTQKIIELDNDQIKELVAPKIEELKHQRAKINDDIALLQKSLTELTGNVASVIEIREMLQSFQLLYHELPQHKQSELLAYIIQSISVMPTKIEMALFGRATLEQFTLTGGVFAQRPNWLRD